LSQEFEQALRQTMTARTFPKGAFLYQQGMAAEGVYLLETGSVRVLLPATDKTQLLQVVGPGALLGLSESMSGDRYRVTVETGEPTTAAFMPRKNFLEFLDQHHEFCMQVVRLLSENLHGLYHRFRSVSAHPGRPRRRAFDEQLN
jgi:CRP/FNR family transcriptional regulator